MRKLLVLLFALGALLLVSGCSKGEENPYPTLTYMVDGTVFYEDVLESEGERFGAIGREPQKDGVYFGGWYYDEGTWKSPLNYTDLNNKTDKSDVTVYAKWEVVDLVYEESTRTYTVVGLLAGAGDTVVIPAKYGDLPIATIAAGAFRANASLKAVTIPDSVTSIGDYAFAECPLLEAIVLPNSVKTIGRNAFSSCISLTSAKLSTALQEIPAELFAGCSKLTIVNIPATVTKIGARAFSRCLLLSDVTIPLSVRTLGLNLFEGTAVTTLKYAGSASSWDKVSRNGFADGSVITAVACTDETVLP